MYPWETAQKIYFSGGSLTVRLSRDFFHNCLTSEPITHTHPEYELHYVKQGGVVLTTKETKEVFSEKSILIIPPSFPHTVTALTEEAVTYTLLFSPDIPYTPDAVYSAVCRSKLLSFEGVISAESRLLRIKDALFASKAAYTEIIRGELTLLFAELSATQNGASEIKQSEREENRAGTIENYLAESYSSPDCSCADLARLMGLSERQVHRLCISYYGLPFREMLHRRRMEIARHRLRLGINTVTEIAEQMGYASLASFSAAYKRHFGHSPNKDI